MTVPASGDFIKRLNQLSKDADALRNHLGDSADALARDDAERAEEIDTLANTIARSLEFIRREGQTMAMQIQQLHGLTETATLINSSLEPVQVLEGVIDTIIRLTGAERAYIVLIEGEELKIRAARNWDMESVVERDATFSRSIINATLADKKSVVTTNAQQDERFQTAQSVMFKAMRSVLCVPLVLRGESIGVIYADNRIMPGMFDNQTVALIETFAHQAAVAIDNARQFETVRAELNEAQKMVQTIEIHINAAERDRNFRELVDFDFFRQLEEMVHKRRKGR